MKTPLSKDLINSLKDQQCPEKLNAFCPSRGQSPWPANIKGMGQYDWDFRLQWAKEKILWKVRRSKVTSWADSHRDTPVLTVSLLHFASLCSWSVRFVQGSFLWLGDLRCFYLNKQTSLTHKYLVVFITNGILFPSALQMLILTLFILLCHFTERIRNLSMGWREWSRNPSLVFALVSSWESKTRLLGFLAQGLFSRERMKENHWQRRRNNVDTNSLKPIRAKDHNYLLKLLILKPHSDFSQPTPSPQTQRLMKHRKHKRYI